MLERAAAKPLEARSSEPRGSAPLVVGDRVLFGSEDGMVYGLKAANGRIDWTYRAALLGQGLSAYKDGRVFFGDYADAP